MHGLTARQGHLLWAATLLGACSSPPKLQGPGAPCFQVTDCALGLVCAPPEGSPDGPRRCTSDTSTLVSTEGASDAARQGARDPLESSVPGDEVTPDAMGE
ncbi:MAG: hypothetical protein M3O36_20565 [Myxococcota bacterium]|nr:hypothetical protein [Myxococcota bacterium]